MESQLSLFELKDRGRMICLRPLFYVEQVVTEAPQSERLLEPVWSGHLSSGLTICPQCQQQSFYETQGGILVTGRTATWVAPRAFCPLCHFEAAIVNDLDWIDLYDLDLLRE